jgi:enoyl-CoA hydratase/carnithine racemase
MNSTPVRVDELHQGAVLRLTLCGPPGNPLDAAAVRALYDALDGATDRRRKLILFAAEGPSFCVGRDDDYETLAAFDALLLRLIALGVPSAAMVQGECLGAGLELAAFTNFVFAAADARFGLGDPVGAWSLPISVILPLKLGARPDDRVLAGETLDAYEAYRRGLVLALAPAPSLPALVEAWIAAHLLPRSAASLRRAHQATRQAFHARLARELPLLERLHLPPPTRFAAVAAGR